MHPTLLHPTQSLNQAMGINSRSTKVCVFCSFAAEASGKQHILRISIGVSGFRAHLYGGAVSLNLGRMYWTTGVSIHWSIPSPGWCRTPLLDEATQNRFPLKTHVDPASGASPGIVPGNGRPEQASTANVTFWAFSSLMLRPQWRMTMRYEQFAPM